MNSRSSKNSSLSDKLASLIDPTPSFDPEDEAEEDTRAKLPETFHDEGDDEEFAVSSLRRQAAPVNFDDDKRYAGKKISRKDLDNSSDDGNESGGEDEEEEVQENTGLSQSIEDGSDDDDEESDDDNLMESSGYQDEEGDDDGDEESDNDGDIFPDEEAQPGVEQENGSAFKHFSSADSASDAQKGASIKSQLLIWDNLLEFRIQLQKSLKAANQMPLPEDFPKFKNDGGKDFETAQKKCASSVSGLIEKLLDLQNALLKQNPETKKIQCGKRASNETPEDNEEIPSSDEEIDSEEEDNKGKAKAPPKKKKKLEDFCPLLTSSHNSFINFRNTTIQKWSDKTRIAQGKFSSKNFSAFEQSTLKQIEHIMADKGRLLKRTRTRRSQYRILGTAEDEEILEAKQGSDAKSEDLCDEIFDDDDFYHQLLRELIEHKSEGISDPVQLGRQWIALQKYRSKMKRKIDTRATKGRKIRYTVIPKLVNFMAPVDRGTWSEGAKDELFNSLFAS